MTSVQAGEVERRAPASRPRTSTASSSSRSQGQTDILTMGIPYICPYNVHSIMNPILVMCMGLGYFFNLYRGKPLVREGGVVIMTHPTQPDFHPVHHPSYIDFYEQVLADTTDPHVMSKQWEERYANDEWYRHLYRTGNAYHGVHPFYMWYWGAHGMQHCGRVIIVGGDPKAVRRLGFVPASTLDDALEIASDVVGRSPTITHLHTPPILMADVKSATERRLAGRHGIAAARGPHGPAGSVERAVGRRRPRRAAATSGSRTAPRRCRAASRCPASRRSSAPTTTPSGPARPSPASPVA